MTSATRPDALLNHGLCSVCQERLVDGRCPNAVCSLPDRGFSRIFTVSEAAEETWRLVYRYKYQEEKHLAEELGRMLVAYFAGHCSDLRRYELYTPSALYIGPMAHRLWDYLQLIVDAAARMDDRWPLAPGLITKVRPTGRFLGASVEERRAIAEGELRAALKVVDPGRVEGKRVLVIDDVYSEGFTLREMARALRRAGAVEVAGLVFARRKGA